MKVLPAMPLMFVIALTANAQTDQGQGSAQAALDRAMGDLKGTLSRLSALDESDKKLAASDQVQTDTTESLNRLEGMIKDEDIPAIAKKDRAYRIELKQITDSGCPTGGGTVPKALADRCNPLIDHLNTVYAEMAKDVERVTGQLVIIETTRKAVSDTVLANALQHKANNALRGDLAAERLKLWSQVIARAMAVGVRQQTASKACESLSDEAAHCCHSVVWDGEDPRHCDVELLVEVFAHAGVFSGGIVVPAN
jgi:hypothetical protein